MNITYIIGNGFDINLGLKTDYATFCDYYTRLKSNDNLINDFKNVITKNPGEWSALETALGQYTQHCLSVDEFSLKYGDMYKELMRYLRNIDENSQFILEKVPQKFYEEIIDPCQYLNTNLKNLIRGQIKDSQSQNVVNFISLNYTQFFNVFTRGFQGHDITVPQLPKFRFGDEICYVHGSIKGGVVQFGVNDPTQIANQLLSKDQGLVHYFVKPEANRIRGELEDKRCEDIIKNSHLICVFGASCGITDKCWWTKVLDVLSVRPAHMIWFVVDNAKTRDKLNDFEFKLLDQYRLDMVNKFCSDYYSHIDLMDIPSRIHVALNTPMFKCIENSFSMPKV